MVLNLHQRLHPRLRRSLAVGSCAALAASGLLSLSVADTAPGTTANANAVDEPRVATSAALTSEPNDEIHSSLGDSSGEVWLYWHGPDNVVHYGPDTSYGQTALASPPTISPKDLGGHWQVKLTGLTSGTTYHYKIGASGLDHTFKTAPTGNFEWLDIGDTGTTYAGGGCSRPWMSQVWQQLADDHPDLVTHGGDITYAHFCGLPSVHQFWNDIQPLATQAPIEFAWGNHESGSPDSIANYKGRFNVPNAQTVSIDTPTRVTSPGCPAPGNPTVNGCRGHDWGYFTAGHVLFITQPEPWTDAFADWHTKADALMAQAENDPNIYLIVTIGHRPAYSNVGIADASLQPILDDLASKYSPTARPDGKYVANIAHHTHNGQVISPKLGLLHVVNGGGGYEQTTITNIKPGTLWLTNHMEYMRATVTGAQLKLEFICGPVYPPDPNRDACTQGDVLFTKTLTGYQGEPIPAEPQMSTTLSDGGVSDAELGDTLVYQGTLENTRIGTTATGSKLTMTLPTNLTVLDPGGATVNGNVLSWNLGDLNGGQSVTKTVRAQLTSGTEGEFFDVALQAQTTDNACAVSGSTCTAIDSNLIVSPFKEYVTNTGFETTKSGWTGLYNAQSKTVRVKVATHQGVYSLKVIRNTTTAGAAGAVSKPGWVPSTTADSDFAASAWVRGQKSGQTQTVVLQIKEVNPAGVVVGSNSTSLTFSDLTWHRLDVPYTTAANGNHLDFVIYSPNLKASAWFLTDSVSLLGPRF